MTPKRLTRSRDDRWFAGVCGGLEDYTGIDSTLWRLAAVVATVLTGCFPMVVGYLIAWAVVPRAPYVTATSTTPSAPPPPSV